MKKIVGIIQNISLAICISIICVMFMGSFVDNLKVWTGDLDKIIKKEEQKNHEILLPIVKDIPKTKPESNSEYGTVKIPSIAVELPIYYGTTSKILKRGLGHDTASYLPGQGGSIILMGHNFRKFLARLPETKKGDKIEITTGYGVFEYEIYDSKIVNESNVEAVPIQEKEEILMIYTCWPINNITHAYERYVIYAR